MRIPKNFVFHEIPSRNIRWVFLRQSGQKLISKKNNENDRISFNNVLRVCELRQTYLAKRFSLQTNRIIVSVVFSIGRDNSLNIEVIGCLLQMVCR